MKLAHPCNRHAFFIYANRKVPFSEVAIVTVQVFYTIPLQSFIVLRRQTSFIHSLSRGRNEYEQ